MRSRRLIFWAAALLLIVGARLDAQRIADEQSRREAVQFYRHGQDFMSAEKFERAAEEFAKAVEKDSLFTLARYSLGQAHMNLQRYGSAIKAFQGCIEAARALYSLAETNRFAVEKQRQDEIHEMRETVQVLQKSGHQLLATRAEQHLQDLEMQKTSIGGGFRAPAEVLLSLGSAYFRNGDREAAEVQWKAAVDVNPKLAEAHNNLAVIFMQTGRLDASEDEMKLAEKNGFRVNPQFKQDLKDRRKKP
jgi:tetratricopeptide (TPR) repeat protein